MAKRPSRARQRSEPLHAVRDAIVSLVQHHFPQAAPYRLEETHYAFGVDRHTVDDTHACRYVAPVKEQPEQYPGFFHYSFHLSPADVMDDASLRSVDQARAELAEDLNLLFTGQKEGEAMPGIGLPRAGVSTSTTHHSGNVIVYGTPDELHARMQKHLARHTDLQQLLPGSRGRQR